MSQIVTEGELAFVLMGALVVLLCLQLRNGKRSRHTKKERSESTIATP